jgi:pimeloyl-ACP methyl ester carboxylesterase
MDKIIKIDNKEVFYRLRGTGNPVLLVHGFGETGEVWNNQAAFLGQHYQLIIPDLPGSGQSGMINDMSVEGLAESLAQILGNEGLFPGPGGKTTPVIGHSMGGYVTLAFAEKYGNLLPAFGLFHSTAYADSEEKKAVRRKGIEFIRGHGALAFLETTSPNLFSTLTREQSPGLVKQFIAGLSGFSPEALVAYYEAMIRRPDRSGLLKTFDKPILFVIGQQDNAIPFQDVIQQTHFPSIAFVHIMQQSGHMGMLEEPGKSNALLLEFLNAVAG